MSGASHKIPSSKAIRKRFSKSSEYGLPVNAELHHTSQHERQERSGAPQRQNSIVKVGFGPFASVWNHAALAMPLLGQGLVRSKPTEPTNLDKPGR